MIINKIKPPKFKVKIKNRNIITLNEYELRSLFISVRKEEISYLDIDYIKDVNTNQKSKIDEHGSLMDDLKSLSMMTDLKFDLLKLKQKIHN